MPLTDFADQFLELGDAVLLRGRVGQARLEHSHLALERLDLALERLILGVFLILQFLQSLDCENAKGGVADRERVILQFLTVGLIDLLKLSIKDLLLQRLPLVIMEGMSQCTQVVHDAP